MKRYLLALVALLLAPGAAPLVGKAWADAFSNTAPVTSATVYAATGVANIMAFGAKCDGTTADDAAFTAAIATGRASIAVPSTGSACVVSGTITPQSGQTIAGLDGKPTIKLVSGSNFRLFNLTGLTNVIIRDLTLDATGAAAGSDFIRFLNTTNSRLLNNTITSPTATSAGGCVLLAQASTDNEVAGNTITNCAASAIVGNNVLAVRNKIHHNTISGSAEFGIRLLSGAGRSEIANNIVTTITGIEPIAVSIGSAYNRITANHVEGSTDNGISIVGDHNIIASNEVVRNAKAGIYIWGAYNTVSGNNMLDNNLSVAGWPCLGAATNYGATGQFNTFTGNTCDDDQAVPTQLGIVVNTAPLTLWSAGAAITAGTWYYYGLNTYQAVGSGTSGATPPTCTSGTCSDGTITWTYLATYQTQAGPFFNSFTGNTVVRYAGTQPLVNVPLPSEAMNRNPDFVISQLFQNNATPASVASNALIIDGWRFLNSNNNQFVLQRTTSSIAGLPFAEIATAQTNFALLAASQFTLINRMEATRFAALGWGTSSAQPLTLEMCARLHGVTGPVAVSLDNGGSGGTFQTYLTSVNVTTADTWQCFSQNIPGATSGTWGSTPGAIGGRLGISLGLGSNQLGVAGWQAAGAGGLYGISGLAQVVSTSAATLSITGVRLYRAGSIYVPRTYEAELALAQRWFWSTFSNTVAVASNQGVAGAYCTTNPVAAGQPSLFIAPTVKMYGVPGSEVVTTFNPSAANANWRDVTTASDVTVSVDPASAKGANGVHLTTSGTVAAQGDTLCIHATIDSGL